MCGIVGVIALNQQVDISVEDRKRAAFFLHNEILFHTVDRGKDSTGAVMCFPGMEGVADGEPFWAVIKQPVKTEEFFHNEGEETYKYKGQDPNANFKRFARAYLAYQGMPHHIIGHCRQGTVGSAYTPFNNHPIIAGNIIGVHNGKIENYKKIYNKHEGIQPIGEVDSEAIFQLLAENANDRPLDEAAVQFTSARIEGPHAIIAYNRRFPEKVAFWHDTARPLELGYIKQLGLAILCSEKKFVEAALSTYQRTRHSFGINLPKITIDWQFVNKDRGGIIDTQEEIDADVQGHSLVSLFDTVKTSDDYKLVNTTKTVSGGTSSTYSGGTGTGTSVTGGTAASKAPQKVEGDLTDFTAYSEHSESEGADDEDEESTEASISAEAVNVAESAIIGEEEDVAESLQEELAEEEDDSADRAAASDSFLRNIDNPDSFLVKTKESGKFKDILGIMAVTEDEARTAVNRVAGDLWSEGYVYGRQEQRANEEDDFEKLSLENRSLKARVAELDDKNKDMYNKMFKAGALVANMKAFVFAAIIAHDIGKVKNNKIVFSNKMMETLSGENFEGVRMELIDGAFTDKDVIRLSENGLKKKA